ncbi:MAG: hypothetical protein ACYCYK_00550 [Candidatus Dormibacteria bacterium]
MADRVGLLLVAYGAFKFSNWMWLAARVPGRTALLANLVVQYLAFGSFCVLVALALRRPLPNVLRRLRIHRLLWMSPLFGVLAMLVVGIGIGRSVAGNHLLIDDANAMAVCGARAISTGHDPYRVEEIPCLASLHLSPLLATPYRAGPLASVRTYPTPAQILAAANTPDHGGQRLFSPLGKPPLDPLAMVPVARASGSTRATWTLLPILVLLLLVAAVAGPLWPAAGGLLLLTYFLNGSAVNFAANGNGEALAYVLLALSVLSLRRPWVSAVCLGLAVGSNELAWFFLPGYVLLCWDLREWGKRIAGVSLTLLVAVLPLVARYPDSLQAVYNTLRAHTFPLGSGPSELILARFWAGPPRIVWLLATGFAIGAIWIWGVWSPRWRLGAAVLTLAAFWLSWRSLDEYLAQIPLLALVVILVMLRTTRSARDSTAAPATGREVQTTGSATISPTA